MHIQIADFGTSVIVDNDDATETDSNHNANGEKKPIERKNSFVGTAQFVAPEILQHGPIHYGFVSIESIILQEKSTLRFYLDLIFGHLAVLFFK